MTATGDERLSARRLKLLNDFYDAWVHDGKTYTFDGSFPELEELIIKATRVQITPEIEEAAWRAWDMDIPDHAYRSIIKAAFEAAGFEVES